VAEVALAEEKERRRIGLGLHDGIGQSLIVTKLTLQLLGQSTDSVTRKALDDVCGQIDRLLDEVRALSFELSDSVLYEVGFKEAVEAYLIREIQNKHGIVCRLSVSGDFSQLRNETEIVLFRNLRELLVNVVKHADAKNVDVHLTSTGSVLTIEVQDDGIGFEPADSSQTGAGQSHFGLFSVAEQLRFLNGRLEIHSAPSQGTLVRMIAPLRDSTSLDG
jgi:signal transduction histidine kinase